MGVARQQDSRSIDYLSERDAVRYELDETLQNLRCGNFVVNPLLQDSCSRPHSHSLLAQILW